MSESNIQSNQNKASTPVQINPADSSEQVTDSKSKQPYIKKLEFSEDMKKKSRTIGNYHIGKTIGEGTFGKVKMANHILTNEPVAIKILEKDRIVDVTDVERVSREIHILKLIRHPHIIQLYEIIETPKQIFLVMEYCQGGELFDYIVKNQKLDEQEACKFFQELIGGIEYIHKLKIVHRDLKPENLLLDYQKNIKIVDFGLSNTYKKNELLKTACGSPCYAAPEMIAGKKYESILVDIWSCGVILFALLCGYLPFEDQNTSQLYKKILGGEYQIPDWVSPQARDLIQKVLNTDPNTRYGFESIKKHPWFQIYKRSYAIPPGIIVGYNRIPIDYKILKELTNYDITVDYAQNCIDANKHNDVTTTYHLLLRKHLNEGGKSEADLNSETFDITLLEPKPRPNKLYFKQAGISDHINGSQSTNNAKQIVQSRIRASNSMYQPPKQYHSHNPSRAVDSSADKVLQSQDKLGFVKQNSGRKQLNINYQKPNVGYPKTATNNGIPSGYLSQTSKNQEKQQVIGDYLQQYSNNEQQVVQKKFNSTLQPYLQNPNERQNSRGKSVQSNFNGQYIQNSVKRNQRSTTSQNYSSGQNSKAQNRNQNFSSIGARPLSQDKGNYPQQIQIQTGNTPKYHVPHNKNIKRRENNYSQDYTIGGKQINHDSHIQSRHQKANSMIVMEPEMNNAINSTKNRNLHLLQQSFQVQSNNNNYEHKHDIGPEVHKSLLNATAVYSSKNSKVSRGRGQAPFISSNGNKFASKQQQEAEAQSKKNNVNNNLKGSFSISNSQQNHQIYTNHITPQNKYITYCQQNRVQ